MEKLGGSNKLFLERHGGQSAGIKEGFSQPRSEWESRRSNERSEMPAQLIGADVAKRGP